MIPDRRMMSIQAQVGGRPRQKGLRMMRKTTLILLGATAGAAMTLFATQPHMTFAVTSAKAAVADMRAAVTAIVVGGVELDQ
jgi:hypothetical protein